MANKNRKRHPSRVRSVLIFMCVCIFIIDYCTFIQTKCIKTFLESMFICQIAENCFDNTTRTINKGHGYNILNKGTRVAEIKVISSHYQIWVYLPVIPTSVSRSSVNAASVTGGAIANTGKNNLENKPVSFSRPNRLFKLLRRVTVIIGNELDNVRTGNRARKYRRKSTGQTSPISNTMLYGILTICPTTTFFLKLH